MTIVLRKACLIAVCAALLAPAAPALGAQAEADAGPVVVKVDPGSVKPRHKPLPGFERGSTRPVAGLLDSDGVQADFVANEMVVTTTKTASLDMLLRRWNGQILQTLVSRKPEIPPQYLVRVDTRLADPAWLSDNLGKLNDGRSHAEQLTVSSDTGLGLLAAAAQEAVRGDTTMTVGVNWLTEQTGVGDGSSYEAAYGPKGFNDDPDTYSRNAFDWSHLNSGSVQDIGVTRAWQLLESLGLLQQRVHLGIIDQGFAPAVNNDQPPINSMKTVIPFTSADDPAYWGPYAWHGTDVASAAAAVPDNFTGGAGPAGPVAVLDLVYGGPDYFSVMFGIGRAMASGSRIISMSFTGRVHWALAWTVIPFDLFTQAIHGDWGVLLIAAAGNDGESVDKTTCLFVCWEKYWVTPCENAGVRCVGGLARNSRNRDSGSNWGHEDVDIFAPYYHIVGANPDRSTPHHAYEFQGTSAATPYTAGVAALIWAANPSLNAGDVEDILLRNRKVSPDTKVKTRVINAYDAVRDALPATVHITAPDESWTLPAHTPTVFKATTYADGHGGGYVTWRVDGNVVATGHTVSFLPPPGAHAVTATATFADSTTATDSIQINVYNYPPTVHISSPADDNGIPSYGQSEPIQFHGSSLDDAGPLEESQVSWHLDGSPAPFATGHNPTTALNTTLGDHTIVLVGCDTFGVCTSDSVLINIQPDGANQPPQVSITNPTAGSQHWVDGTDASGHYAEITLGSNVIDPEAGPLTLIWFDNGIQVATGPNPTVKFYTTCGNWPHHLVLRATDNAGNTREDAVDFGTGLLC